MTTAITTVKTTTSNKGGAVAERSKALQLREKTNKNQKITGSSHRSGQSFQNNNNDNNDINNNNNINMKSNMCNSN